MSKLKGKWIEDDAIGVNHLNTANEPSDTNIVEYDGASGKLKYSAKPSFTDGKDVKVSSGDTTPGFLDGKIQVTEGEITKTKNNAGGNETLTLGVGSTVFKKGTDTTDSVTEGATNKYYTDARADARITAQKGVANGLASLGADGKVPSAQLPAYVDDVLEYANLAGFPATGSTGVIYVAQDTNKTYRWSGSAYVEISSSLALGTTSSTAFRGDYGNTAYQHSQTAHAPSTAQKNSDITKAEIEAKLTGEISTHTHARNVTKKVEIITLSSTDISNKYIDLTNTPIDGSAVEVHPSDGIPQTYGLDFSVVTNGSVIKRLSWSGLAMDGILASGDKLVVSYTH
ncbi:MAG: hypothetical protein RBU23_13000 [Candidatus Auribacterota bacterium]|jgi:hypothetical protein|nr:hypothetical protein [Candidatus Auribacterota bacterium]